MATRRWELFRGSLGKSFKGASVLDELSEMLFPIDGPVFAYILRAIECLVRASDEFFFHRTAFGICCDTATNGQLFFVIFFPCRFDIAFYILPDSFRDTESLCFRGLRHDDRKFFASKPGRMS